MSQVPTPEELLSRWGGRAKRRERGHIEFATRYERLHYRLGIPVVILSVLVGTSQFASFQEVADVFVKIGGGVVSIAMAILAGLQTFLGYSDRAEKHRIAASKYGALMREIEQIQTFAAQEDNLEKYCESLLHRWNELGENSSTVPQWMLDRIDADIKAEIDAQRMSSEQQGRMGKYGSMPTETA